MRFPVACIRFLSASHAPFRVSMSAYIFLRHLVFKFFYFHPLPIQLEVDEATYATNTCLFLMVTSKHLEQKLNPYPEPPKYWYLYFVVLVSRFRFSSRFSSLFPFLLWHLEFLFAILSASTLHNYFSLAQVSTQDFSLRIS